MLSLPATVVTWPAVAWVSYYGNLSKVNKVFECNLVSSRLLSRKPFSQMNKINDPINSRYFYSQGKIEGFHWAISVCTSHYSLDEIQTYLFLSITRSEEAAHLHILIQLHITAPKSLMHMVPQFILQMGIFFPHSISCDGLRPLSTDPSERHITMTNDFTD